MKSIPFDRLPSCSPKVFGMDLSQSIAPKVEDSIKDRVKGPIGWTDHTFLITLLLSFVDIRQSN